jgi:hypothetical protein
MFASVGDNITPPQQAFNWVADVYGSTEEIKARGQVIVGLMHEDVGHLGIFVSGKVAKKEGTQIASVLKSIESLPPGLYGMQIAEKKKGAGKPVYEVSFVELRLEDIVGRLNRFKRADERAFEAVSVVSEFNQRAYELFGRPLVKSFANEYGAKLARGLHPLRMQRWAFSDLNPWLWWLAPTAQAVKAKREALGPNDPARTVESTMSELTSALLDCYRALRDASSEGAFFQIYGNLFSFYLSDEQRAEGDVQRVDPRELPFVKETLASVDQGGYAEALARVAFLLAHKDEPLPLSRLELAHELIEEYREWLPELTPNEARRMGGEQETIARYAPEQAIETLPALLAKREDRERLLTLLARVLADRRVQRIDPSPEQTAMLARIRGVLAADGYRSDAARSRSRKQERAGKAPRSAKPRPPSPSGLRKRPSPT